MAARESEHLRKGERAYILTGDFLPVYVGEVDRVVWAYAQAVGNRVVRAYAQAMCTPWQRRPPHCHQVALTVKYHQLMGASGQNMDPVLRVNSYTTGIYERFFLRELRPPINQLISVFATAILHSVSPSSVLFFVPLFKRTTTTYLLMLSKRLSISNSLLVWLTTISSIRNMPLLISTRMAIAAF